MFLDDRNCPKCANCLRVLNCNSPADNHRRRMLGSESRGQDIDRIFHGGQVLNKFCREEDHRRSVKLNGFEQEAGCDIRAEVVHCPPLGAD